jgi:hypothetical protein
MLLAMIAHVQPSIQILVPMKTEKYLRRINPPSFGDIDLILFFATRTSWYMILKEIMWNPNNQWLDIEIFNS